MTNSTVFVSKLTPVTAGWANDVNAVVFEAVADGGGNPPTTPAQIATNIGAVTLAELANTTNPTLGDALLGIKQPFTGAVARTQHGKNQDIVTPQDFGAVADGVTDDSAAIVLAANYAHTNNKLLYMTGNYGISKLTFSGYEGLAIVWGCTLTAISSTAQTCLFEMANCSNIYAVGNLSLNLNYNLNYAVGLWIYSPTASQFMNLGNIAVAGAKIAFRFGSPSYVDAIISEITISGGHTYGCPSICDLYGTQTVISVHGVNWSADFGNGAGAWLSLPTVGVSANGSYVSFHGGEVLMTDITGGVLFESKPITSISYNNRYGSIVAYGVTVETASPLARAVNPGSVSVAANTGDLNFDGCTGYHSQDLAAFIASASDYTGRIRAAGNRFYSTVLRTQYNILSSGNAVIDCDKTSFWTGFKSWLLGISGGINTIDNGGTLYKNANQSIGASAWTKVTFNAALSSTIRGMDLANNRFVIPYDGIYTATFTSYGSSSTVASRYTGALYLNGVLKVAGSTGYSNAANTPANSDVEMTLLLSLGDVIECYGQPDAANFTLCNSLGNCLFTVTQTG